MVQPAENISRSYPAIAWQLMAMDAWGWLRPTIGIRNAWSQAGVGASAILQVEYKTPIKLAFEKSSTAGTHGVDSAYWYGAKRVEVAVLFCAAYERI